MTIKRLIIGILTITFLVLFPHFVPLPFFSYSVVCLVLILLLLKYNNKTLANIGLSKSGLTIRALSIGALSAVLLVCFGRWVYQPFINHFWKDLVGTYTEYDFIKGNPVNFIISLVAAWLVAGFYEEIAFRGYIHTTLREMFGKCANSFWIAGLITTVLFGLYHYQQGVFGMVSSGIAGLVWICLLRYSKGNLWYPILSHAIYDTILLTLIYSGNF